MIIYFILEFGSFVKVYNEYKEFSGIFLEMNGKKNLLLYLYEC